MISPVGLVDRSGILRTVSVTVVLSLVPATPSFAVQPSETPSVSEVGREAIVDSEVAPRDKVVCRLERRTGTRMKTKVCRTVGQIADEREGGIRTTKKIQNNRRVKQGR